MVRSGSSSTLLHLCEPNLSTRRLALKKCGAASAAEQNDNEAGLEAPLSISFFATYALARKLICSVLSPPEPHRFSIICPNTSAVTFGHTRTLS